MSIEITVLADNTARSRYLAEWGLSILIETEGFRILFDTGRTTALHNAALMGKTPIYPHAIVLSHGHYDHTEGLLEILQQTGGVAVYAHPAVFDAKYALRLPGNNYEYIGIPFSRSQIEQAGGLLHLGNQPCRLTPRITTSGEIPLESTFEKTDDHLLEMKGDSYYPDRLADDLALGIETSSGLIVIAGCAHHGIINTIQQLIKVTGEQRLRAVMGGFHLYNADQLQIRHTAAWLKEAAPEKVIAGHCTGFKASCALQRTLGSRFLPMAVGMRVSF